MKQKKTLSIVLLSVLITSMTAVSLSCSTPKVNNDSAESQTGRAETALVAESDISANTFEGETSVYVYPEDQTDFLLNSFESGVTAPNSMKGMLLPESQGVYTAFTKSKQEDLTGKQILVFDETFTYQDSTVYWKTISEEEIGSFYSSYDRYKDENGATVMYLSGTNMMTLYLGSLSEVESAATPLTLEEAKAVADEFLQSILPEDIFVNIPWFSTSEGATSTISVGYQRSIHGYLTDEDILVMVDVRTRKIKGYNGQCVGKYTDLEQYLTKESLDTAYEKLKTKLLSLELSNLEMLQPSLTTSTDGEVYMSLPFTCFNESSGTPDMLELLCKVEAPTA